MSSSAHLQHFLQTIESLKSDRLFKIVVGKETSQPYFVSQAFLESASDYFKKAVKNEHLGGEPGVLRFPEDDTEAWKSLLYWMIWHALPGGVTAEQQQMPKEGRDVSADNSAIQLQCVRCWALGDKYGMLEFQDLIMLELLESLSHGIAELDTVKEAFDHTPPGSPLRELMAEEVVSGLESEEITYDDLSVLAQKMDCKGGNGHYDFCPRLPTANQGYYKGQSPYWVFMVGGGPKQHWLHDRVKEATDDGFLGWQIPESEGKNHGGGDEGGAWLGASGE